LNINEYISKLEALLHSPSIIASYQLNIDRKSSEIAFISGKIEFRNGTFLDFKEFIENTDKGIEKYKYAYNYRKGQTASSGMIMPLIREQEKARHSRIINIFRMAALKNPNR